MTHLPPRRAAQHAPPDAALVAAPVVLEPALAVPVALVAPVALVVPAVLAVPVAAVDPVVAPANASALTSPPRRRGSPRPVLAAW